jgi:hypothetical protein
LRANRGFAFMPEHSLLHCGTIHGTRSNRAVERTIPLMTMPGWPSPPSRAPPAPIARWEKPRHGPAR